MGEPESHIHPVCIGTQRDVGVRTVETREDRLRIERNLLAVEPNLRFTRYLSDSGKVPRPVEWFSTTVDTVSQTGLCVAGLFPEDWKPLWAKTDADATTWYCRNKPRFLLVIPPVPPPKLQERARPAANDDSIGYMDRFQVIAERQWYGVYEADDLEAKRWLQRMIRIVKKGMTNRCCYISYLTGYPVHRCEKGSSTWFAPGAIAWARQEVNRFLAGLFRPEDEFETFHWPLPTGGTLCNWSVTKRQAEEDAYWARALSGSR